MLGVARNGLQDAPYDVPTLIVLYNLGLQVGLEVPIGNPEGMMGFNGGSEHEKPTATRWCFRDVSDF